MAIPPDSRRSRTTLPGMLRTTPGRADSTAFSIAAIVIVVAFGFLIAKTHAMTHIDLQGDKALNKLHTGFLGALGSGVYKVFSPVEAVLITLLVMVAIWLFARSLRLAITFGAVVAITWIPSDIIKILVHRSRPDPSAFAHHLATQPTDPSYPSGHMVFVTTLALALFFLARGKSFRPLVGVLGIIGVIVVAFCLVSDGVHYPTDVLASILWSLGVVPLVLGLWNRYVLPRTYRTPASPETLA